MLYRLSELSVKFVQQTSSLIRLRGGNQGKMEEADIAAVSFEVYLHSFRKKYGTQQLCLCAY